MPLNPHIRILRKDEKIINLIMLHQITNDKLESKSEFYLTLQKEM